MIRRKESTFVVHPHSRNVHYVVFNVHFCILVVSFQDCCFRNEEASRDDDEVFLERDIVTLNYGFMTVCDDTQLDMRCTRMTMLIESSSPVKRVPWTS